MARGSPSGARKVTSPTQLLPCERGKRRERFLRRLERDGAGDGCRPEVVPRGQRGPVGEGGRQGGVDELASLLDGLGLHAGAAALRAGDVGADWPCFFRLGLGRGRGNVAVGGGGVHAAAGLLVEHEGGGAALQAGVASLARPVPLAGLAEGNVGIGIVLAES